MGCSKTMKHSQSLSASKRHSTLSRSLSRLHRINHIRNIIWSYVLLFLPALILTFYAVVFLSFLGVTCKQDTFDAVIWTGAFQLTASLLIMAGCITRDSRYFAATGVFLLPLTMMLSLRSFLLLQQVQSWLSMHPTVAKLEYLNSCQKNMCALALGGIDVVNFFGAMFAIELFLYVVCMLIPKWLNSSLRVHRIFVRKVFLFQFRFDEIDESFYKF